MSGSALQQLDSAIERFAVPLRMGDGIDKPALNDLKRTLTDTARQWRAADVVPKRSAALLVELYPALTGTLDLYDGEHAERVRQVCEELLQLSLACFEVEG